MTENRKIKVLQGIRQGKVGGGESVLLSLAENINKEKFDPVVLSFTDGPMVDQLKVMGIPVHVIPTEKPFDRSVWKRVQQLMVDEQIDLAHAHGTRAASNMFWAAKKSGLPLIYTCHGWSFHQDQNVLKKRIRIWGEKFLTKKAAVNICVSHANREEGRRLFGNSFDPVVIQNSIDSKKFDPQKKYRDVRRELNICESALLLGFIARFTWQKQPLVLIRAFADVLSDVPGARLLMVGDGEEKDEALSLINELGLKDKITLISFRSDVPDVLAAIDIFILPSLWEGLPVALLEAMSMAKPIIATDVDGTAEVIEDGISGYLIKTENLKENLAVAIAEMCRDKPLREKLSSGARNRITRHYNVRSMTEKNEEIYLQLFHKHFRKQLTSSL